MLDAMFFPIHLPAMVRDRKLGEKSCVWVSLLFPLVPESFSWEPFSEETIEILHSFGLGTAIQGSLPVSHEWSTGWISVLSCWYMAVQRMSSWKSGKSLLEVADFLFTTAGHCRKYGPKKTPQTNSHQSSFPYYNTKKSFLSNVALETQWYLVLMRSLSMPRTGNCGGIKVYFSLKLLIIYENSSLVKKPEHLFQKISTKKTFCFTA